MKSADSQEALEGDVSFASEEKLCRRFEANWRSLPNWVCVSRAIAQKRSKVPSVDTHLQKQSF